MPRPALDATARRCNFLLGERTRTELEEIATELTRRTRHPANLTDALKWATRELSARIALEKKAKGSATLTAPGPMTPPRADPIGPRKRGEPDH